MKVSIIVPVYNVEKYLNRCLDSIINQTYKNIEIILINDGSTDDSGVICEEYKVKDKRIKLIHKENGGLSDARNVGLENALGEYVFFVDSDDSIELDTIEYLMKAIEKYDVQIVCCGLSNYYLNGKKEKVTIPNEPVIYSKEEALDIHLLPGYIEDITCNKLIKKELLKDIRWPVGLLYEDMRTTYKILDKAEKIVLMPESKYNYFKRENSIGGLPFSNKTLDLLNACDEAVNFVKEKQSYNKALFISEIHWYIVVLNKMILANKIDYELINIIRKKIKANLKNIITTKYINKIRKFQILCLYNNFWLYKISYKLYLKINR